MDPSLNAKRAQMHPVQVRSCVGTAGIAGYSPDGGHGSESKVKVIVLDEDKAEQLVSCNAGPSPDSICKLSPDRCRIENTQQTCSPVSGFVCFICQIDLTLFDSAAREAHVNKCLDGSAADCSLQPCVETERVAEVDPEDSELQNIKGLKAEDLSCVICGIDISRRALLSRCLHIKRCARENHVKVRDVIRMLSDHDDISGPVDLTADGEEDNNGFVAADIANCSSSAGNSINDILMRNARNSVKAMPGGILTNSNDAAVVAQLKESSEARTVNNFLMSAAREGAATKKRSAEISAAAPKAVRNAGRWGKKSWGAQAGKTGTDAYLQDSYAPDFKKIQQDSLVMPIVVDGFQYASAALTDTYFLTHFHSDHYGGLDSKFNCGRIYCSPATAALTQLRLRVPPSVLMPLALEVKHTILVGGAPVGVTLIDANHCPGAVLLLFEFRSGRRVLHTGDFRYTRDMASRSASLRELIRATDNTRNLVVYLDTTYCDPLYCFPEQSVAIEAVVAAVQREMSVAAEKTLFAFGAYGIGKERVFMAVAKALDMKVFVDGSRWKAMMCYDWSVSDKARLTTDGSITPLWVVAMSQINFKALNELKNKANNKKGPKNSNISAGQTSYINPCFTRVIGFQPTGWSHKPSDEIGGGGDLVTPRYKGKDIVYAVPYSEHSSFSELVAFVDTFAPQRIVPTVNTGREKVKTQLDLLKQHSRAYLES